MAGKALPVSGMSTPPVIRARGLKKTYRSGIFRKKRNEALRGIDLSIGKGALYGILGPNGAGKTTLLSLLSTLNLPDSGELTVMGLDARKSGETVRGRVNITSGSPNFLWTLTVEENLKFYRMLYGLRDNSKIDELIALFGLGRYRRTRFDELSTGTKHKLALAKALVNDPEILFLDEPTVGLDPDVSIRVRELIHTIHREKGVTIVLTTHYMREAEELCERIAFLKEGEVLAEGTPEELKGMIRATRRVEITYRGAVEAKAIEAVGGVKGAEFSGSRVAVSLSEPEECLDELLAAVRSTAKICHVKVSEVDLEDVFIAFTRP